MSRAARHGTTQDLARAAPIFFALGDQTRLALLVRLGSTGPNSIAQLAAESAVTRQAVTKHLQVLADVGLVRSERRGRESIWNFEIDRLHDARRFLDEVSVKWDEALDRLKDFVEK